MTNGKYAGFTGTNFSYFPQIGSSVDYLCVFTKVQVYHNLVLPILTSCAWDLDSTVESRSHVHDVKIGRTRLISTRSQHKKVRKHSTWNDNDN